MHRIVVLSCAIHCCLSQSISSPALDWIQSDGSGAYRYGYASGDEGRHYHVQSASADNTVAGKFGYKEPGTGRDLQTTYTAGRRGFRARGPHIARRMDLSQTKPPFSRPNDDGQYHPELDNYFDPNEDRGFDYSYRTPDHIKEEHANRVGDVQGRYSYLDDIGFRHNVHYKAGSKTGFVVTNPVPDTFARARGGPLYYVGKTGGSKVRGFSAVQKNLNGAYRFLASGPDHKRSEVSDAAGNRRGVYTYLDDKGIQHTVEYIAGPKIGYKVINNKKGVNYNPILPFFPDTPTIQPLFPASSTGGDSPSSPFPTPSVLPTSPGGTTAGDDSAFPSLPPTASGSGDISSTSVGQDFSFPIDNSFSTVSPPLGRPSSTASPSLIASHKPFTSVFTPSTEKSPTSLDLLNNIGSSGGFSTTPSSLQLDQHDDFAPPFNYDFDYFFNDPANLNKDWSKPIKGYPHKSSKPKVLPLPDFFPSPIPDIGFPFPDPFDEGLNAAETGAGLKPPFAGHSKTDCNGTTLNPDAGKGGTQPGKGKSFSFSNRKSSKGDSSKHYYKNQKGVEFPSRGSVKFGGVKKTEWHGDKKEDGYFAIPPGVAVRAHVQSLDIVPYSKRFLTPGEALKHHESEEITG